MSIIGLEDGVSLVEFLIFGFMAGNMILSGSMLFGIGVKKITANAAPE